MMKSDELNDGQRKLLLDFIKENEIKYHIADGSEEKCLCCGRKSGARKIAFFADMARALHKVWKWCDERKVYEFNRKEIKHLFTNENQSARFGDWILFGGLVYRPSGKGKGEYGLNLERVRQFFNNELLIPTIIEKKKVDGKMEYIKTNPKNLKDMPELKDLLTPQGNYKLF